MNTKPAPAWLQVIGASVTLLATWHWWGSSTWLAYHGANVTTKLFAQGLLAMVPVGLGAILFAQRQRRRATLALAAIVLVGLIVAMVRLNGVLPSEPLIEIAWAIGRKTYEIGAATSLFAAAVGLGALVLSRVRAVGNSVHLPGLAAGLGLGALAYTYFLLGVVGLLSGWAAHAMIVASAGATGAMWRRRPTYRTLLLGLTRPLSLRPTEPRSWGEGAAVVALWIALLFTSLRALQPEIAMDDSLVYHFAVPQMWVLAGRIQPFPANLFSELPFTVEMLYVPGLLVGSQAIGRLLTVGLQLALLRGIHTTLEERAGTLAARVGCLALTTGFLFWFQVGSGDVDHSVAAFAGLAFVAAVRYLDTAEAPTLRSPWLVLAGLFGGLTAASKLQGALFPAALGVTLALLSWHRLRLRAMQTFLVIGVVSAAIASPWYAKAMIHTGDPAWPWLYPVFHGRWMSDETYAALQANVRMWRGLSPGELAAAIARVVGVRGTPGIPALLGLLPLVALRPVPLPMQLCAVLSGTFVVLAIGMGLDSRFWSPLLGPLCVLMGWLLAEKVTLPAVRLAFCASLFFCFGTGALLGSIYTRKGLLAAVGLQTEREFLSRNLTEQGMDYETYDWVNRNTPRDMKVLVVGQIRLMYLHRPLVFVAGGRETLMTFSELGDPIKLNRKVDELGISGMLIPSDQQDFVSPEFIQARGGLLFATERSKFYEVRSGVDTP